jgi:hypothetical protein
MHNNTCRNDTRFSPHPKVYLLFPELKWGQSKVVTMKNPECVNNDKPLILQLRFDPIEFLIDDRSVNSSVHAVPHPSVKGICLFGIHVSVFVFQNQGL